MLLRTIKNGYTTNKIDYLFQDFDYDGNLVSYQILSPSQVLFGTDKGIILLDLSCSINEVFYTEIESFIQALKEE
jgi:hypothetical protein